MFKTRTTILFLSPGSQTCTPRNVYEWKLNGQEGGFVILHKEKSSSCPNQDKKTRRVGWHLIFQVRRLKSNKKTTTKQAIKSYSKTKRDQRHQLKPKIQVTMQKESNRGISHSFTRVKARQSKWILCLTKTHRNATAALSISLSDTSYRLASQDGGTVCKSTMEHLGLSVLLNVPFFCVSFSCSFMNSCNVFLLELAEYSTHCPVPVFAWSCPNGIASVVYRSQ